VKECIYTQQHAASLMLTHISSVSRTIRVLAVCLMSVPLQNNVYLRMLGYQRKNEVGNLREFGVNQISNSVCELG
jgi:hypothetical protein